MKTLLRAATDRKHQADAIRRDQAFKDDIHCRRIPILKRVQATTASDNCSYQDPVAAAVQETMTPSGTAQGKAGDLKPATRKARDITRHTERIDRQDHLHKIE